MRCFQLRRLKTVCQKLCKCPTPFAAKILLTLCTCDSNMKKFYTNKNRGYIALMATIIISLLLLVMIVNEGFSGWMTRFVVLGTEAKEQANALAEGCADQATAWLITDPAYLGSTTSSMPGGDCTVFGISQTDLQAVLVSINTQAEVRVAFANLELLQNVNNIHLGAIPSAPNYGTLIVQTLVNNPASG